MKITVCEITSRRDLKKFIAFPNKLYKSSKFYVPQLQTAELELLSKEKNSAFEFCEAKYWLAYNEQGTIVGRIAGILNHKFNKKTGEKSIRFGWFDFIENKDVTRMLLKKVEAWGKSINAQYIHGPLGFLEFDASGILVEGFDELPTAYGKYNHPYYSDFIEHLGYTKEVDWVEFSVSVPKQLPDRYTRLYELAMNRNGLSVIKLTSKKQLLTYANDIFQLLNQEYNDLHGFYPISDRQIESLKKQFIPLLQLRYVSLVLNDHNQVVGFGICLPSLSKALQKSNGKLFPFGWVHILRALKQKDTIDTLLIATQKNYRDKGVTSIIFYEIGKTLVKDGFNYIETTRMLEENQLIQNLWNKLEYRQHKRSRCFKKKL